MGYAYRIQIPKPVSSVYIYDKIYIGLCLTNDAGYVSNSLSLYHRKCMNTGDVRTYDGFYFSESLMCKGNNHNTGAGVSKL